MKRVPVGGCFDERTPYRMFITDLYIFYILLYYRRAGEGGWEGVGGKVRGFLEVLGEIGAIVGSMFFL